MGSGGRKRVALGGNKESLCGQKTFYLCKREIFADSEKTLVQKKFLYVKTTLSEVRKAFYKWKTFGLRKRTAFTSPAKLSDKEKTFFSALRHRLPTAPKLTSNCKFYPR